MPIKMKAISSVFFYMLLAIALCSPNVSTFCGNDEQIEDLKTALITQESIFTALRTLSATQVTGSMLAFAQVLISGRFALQLNEVFDEIESSLNKDHRDYRKCSEMLEKIGTKTTIIKSFGVGFSLVSMIPGVSLEFVAPRILTSITAIAVIRDLLGIWQKTGCQYATTRNCNL